jgi:hypothetical protein
MALFYLTNDVKGKRLFSPVTSKRSKAMQVLDCGDGRLTYQVEELVAKARPNSTERTHLGNSGYPHSIGNYGE